MSVCSLITTRRVLLAGVAAALAGATRIERPLGSWAQEGTPVSVATPSARTGLIQPTGPGEVPTTGGSRPGPFDMVRAQAVGEIVAPVGLRVEAAGIDAGIEALRVVDGAMQDPTGPWVVAWYENLGTLGMTGNVVMAGHIDFWNVGPAVFYNLAGLQPGEEAVVPGDDGNLYPYTIDWVEQFDSNTIPIEEVIGPTGGQSLTLITCGGAFDYATGHYLQRTVARASRTGPGVAAPA
jgi:hypothetical protein